MKNNLLLNPFKQIFNLLKEHNLFPVIEEFLLEIFADIETQHKFNPLKRKRDVKKILSQNFPTFLSGYRALRKETKTFTPKQTNIELAQNPFAPNKTKTFWYPILNEETLKTELLKQAQRERRLYLCLSFSFPAPQKIAQRKKQIEHQRFLNIYLRIKVQEIF